MEEKTKHKNESDISNWLNYYLAGCAIVGSLIAVYFIKNPEIKETGNFVNKYKIEYVKPIRDINLDGIPELQVKKEKGSIDTLFSNLKKDKIFYEKSK